MSLEMLMQGVMAVQTVEEQVRIPGYYSLNIDEAGKNIHEYEFEGDFWHGVLGYLPGGQHLDGKYKISPGDRVRLRMFHLSYWAPRVPGLFWKEGSKELRGAAERELLDASPFFDWFIPKVVFRASSGYWKTETRAMQEVYGLDNFNLLPPRIAPIYTPLGKSMQILGGIGNLRLLPSGKGERLLCASSSGTYWQGIPLLVRGDAVNDLSRIIPGTSVDIEGVWVPLPREYAQILGGDTGIQRGCLLAEGKGSIKNRDRNLVSTALTGYGGTSAGWTLFEYRGNDNILRYAYAYVTFNVNEGGAIRYLDQPMIEAESTENVALWLDSYAKYHHGRILTDYDEVMPALDAMFPLSDLTHCTDIYRLKEFLDYVKKRALSPEIVKYDSIPDFLMRHFDLGDIRLLATDYIGLKIEDIIGPNAGKADHVESLFQYCREQDLIEKLFVGCTEMRPDVIKDLDNLI